MRITFARAASVLRCCFGLFAFLVIATCPTKAAESVRVMSFNLWHGGDAGKQPLKQTLAVIVAARADIVGLQETHGYEKEQGSGRPDHGRKLAEMLGWHYFDQGNRTGVLSRYPIVTNTARKWGVKVRLPSGKEAWMFNVHFAAAPYQPYQLVGIPYFDAPLLKTADEAVAAARQARGGQVERMLSELKPALADGQPVFLTGDFNEPSHQDWTERAVAAGLCPLPVAFPSTLAVTGAGMRDAFRSAFPNEVQRPGWTWTPTTKPDDPQGRHDRIDYVFVGGADFTVEGCEIVGEDRAFADVVVQPYPSDHRAVVATVELP